MANEFRFEFDYDGCPPGYLEVIEFEGEEAISQPYSFSIKIRCEDPDLDPDTLLKKLCRLHILIGDKPLRVINGVLKRFDELSQTAMHSIYQAELVSRLWHLNFYHTNEVYLDMTVPEIIEQVMNEAQFTSLDFEFSLLRQYRKWPYRCQFQETHFNFIHRLMEREGIYYFFEQTDQGDKVIFCDHRQFNPQLPDPVFKFDPSSGLEVETFYTNIQSLVSRQQRLPRTVMLRDFNDCSPSVDVKGQTEVDPDGIGETNIWGLNIDSPEEGQELAEIHADAIRARRKLFFGEGTCPGLIAGYEFKLEQHRRTAFNQTYQVIAIQHRGCDPRFFSLSGADQQGATDVYRNSFSALPAELQFRPEVITPKPEINGTLNAVVDAESDGEYAELDAQGRYKVSLPFDRRDRNGGKASHWVRMMQPYGGTREGMHFPLRKGTRVLLSFICGDPDRPIIAGAMPDAEQPSVVTDTNQTSNLIKTAAGNKIEMEDKDGTNRIKLETPHESTYLHLGAPNHDGSGFVLVTAGIERKKVANGQQITVATNNAAGGGVDQSTDELFDERGLFKFATRNANGALDASALTTSEYDTVGGVNVINKAGEVAGKFLIHRRQGEYYLWTDGNEYVFGGGKVFNYGNSYEESHANDGYDDDGNPGNTGIDASNQGMDFLGDTAKEIWPDPDNPNTLTPAAITGNQRWEPGNHAVEKVWSDTFNYQMGYNYSWGDTCDYEFGNGYAESHTDLNDDMHPSHGNGINYASWEHDICSGPTATTIAGSHITLDPNSTGVEKTIGHGYGYTKGNSIEITVGDTEEKHWGNSWEYVHGGTHVEKSYGGIHEEYQYSTAGVIRNKTIEDRSGAGIVTETHMYAYGNPVSYEIERKPAPGTSFTFKGDGLPKLSMGFSTDIGDTSISMHVGAMSNSVEVKAMGMINTVELSAAGMNNSFALDATAMVNKMEISLAALKTEIEISASGLDKFESNMPGLKVRAEAQAAKVEAEAATKLKTQMIEIFTEAVDLKQTATTVDTEAVAVGTGAIRLLS